MTTKRDRQVQPVARRQMLKLLTAVSGTLILSNLPNQWQKPQLKIGILPAHAQTSPLPTHSHTPTPTNTPTPINTPAPINTSTPTNTPTVTPTLTLPPPTSTETPIPYE